MFDAAKMILIDVCKEMFIEMLHKMIRIRTKLIRIDGLCGLHFQSNGLQKR